MKKLSQAECAQIQIAGRGRRSPVFRSIAALEVGEGVLIEPADWNKKYPPTTIANRIARTYNKKFRAGTNLNGSGWLIQRIA